MIEPISFSSVDELLEFESSGADKAKNSSSTVTAREYYCYKFQMRENDESMLVHTGRAFQQFVVDAYIKIESCRLDFHRKKQNEIRTEMLQGVLDSLSFGQTNGINIGRRVVLPASFIGGPRDMRRRYLDAMALVQKYGKPDIFLTITCNPNWPEIQENLKYDETPNDRPDLLARAFRAKLELLKVELFKKQIFGQVAAYVYVIEFQKRGMPHCHFLLILKLGSKLLNPTAYDRIVCAEIPDPKLHPYLYSLVTKHMMHGPCGSMNINSPCMKSGNCKNHYPKNFTSHTYHADDGYPHYRRRNDGQRVRIRNHELDNRWTVPYNPYLLALFDCHMNVEICSTIKLVKYLYKYIYKGHDVVKYSFISIDDCTEIDEIKEFQDARWVGPSEAMWRIFAFKLNQVNPTVYTLQVHLDGQQFVSFSKSSDLVMLAENSHFSRTTLTEFFWMNKQNKKAQDLKLLYKEFPKYFVWCGKTRTWFERKRGDVIGRMVTIDPKDGERYYLRLLLSHVRAPTSYDDLMTVDGKKLNSFRQTALELGFLHSDNYIEQTLHEASQFQMPYALRSLFAILLVYCSPNNPKTLWEKFKNDLSTDMQRTYTRSGHNSFYIQRKVLQAINTYLMQMGKNLKDYNLVSNEDDVEDDEQFTREVISERNIPITAEDMLLSEKLNHEQRHAYDIILEKVFSANGHAFFIDGPGGTGKTFLYRALLVTLRSQGFTAIAVATSGVAASVLPGGRTAHSRFKIPLHSSENQVCQLSKQSAVAKLIIQAKLIVWDEASMARRESLESFDSLLKDLMTSDRPFGGKVVVLGGDFRQTLPVIEKGSKQILIESSIVNSHLWSGIQKIYLKVNMRAILDPIFSEFLLRVGEGRELVDENDDISLPHEIIIPYTEKEESLNRYSTG
ncbi:uncharacterized protein LOC141816402 [Curcuma longa]|uniref:uncharacterized protein LOC141816402 n=1 Tax=Curcuma longa TaxID=136217 RepID=UPI003D9EA555